MAWLILKDRALKLDRETTRKIMRVIKKNKKKVKR